MRYKELSNEFSEYFNRQHFPGQPQTLYGAASYMLEDGGKRIRPVLCLMGNELFGPILEDSWKIAAALELFHNFTLIHDDIMDKAPLRRGKATVHAKYNEPTALLAGDVMLLKVYDYLNEVDPAYNRKLIRLLNKTGSEVCEGQQLDMDFEKSLAVSLEQYLDMIALKTAVLLACCLQMGAIVAGASEKDQEHIYAFGRNLGLAFQVQDDWLDSFGDPSAFGKVRGGDILANKKTFLLLYALENGRPAEKRAILELLKSDSPAKVDSMISVFVDAGVDLAAQMAKRNYMAKAISSLDSISVPDQKKDALKELAEYLLERQI